MSKAKVAIENRENINYVHIKRKNLNRRHYFIFSILQTSYVANRSNSQIRTRLKPNQVVWVLLGAQGMG